MGRRQPVCRDQVKRPQAGVVWAPFVFLPAGSDGVPPSLEQMKGTARGMYSAQLTCTQTSPVGKPPGGGAGVYFLCPHRAVSSKWLWAVTFLLLVKFK